MYNTFAPIHGVWVSDKFYPALVDDMPSYYVARTSVRGFMPIADTHPGYNSLKEFVTNKGAFCGINI
jgi:hypothetical protein